MLVLDINCLHGEIQFHSLVEKRESRLLRSDMIKYTTIIPKLKNQ